MLDLDLSSESLDNTKKCYLVELVLDYYTNNIQLQSSSNAESIDNYLPTQHPNQYYNRCFNEQYANLFICCAINLHYKFNFLHLSSKVKNQMFSIRLQLYNQFVQPNYTITI